MKYLLYGFIVMSFLAGGSFAVAQETMTDAKIVKLMKTEDEGQIDLAKIAKSKTKNKDVKDFAKMMIEEHKKNEKESKDVAKRAKVKPADSTASKDFKNMAQTHEKDLKKLKGSEFDKAYIDQQVSMHKQILDDLNTKLIPTAQSPELKTYLEATKESVQKHLSKAQEIQTTLK
jgi:putative membrane protein